MKNKLAEVRNAKGISQAKLAELSGVPRRTIQDWEAQKFEPGVYKLYRVAQVLGCTIEDLINFEDEEKPE